MDLVQEFSVLNKKIRKQGLLRKNSSYYDFVIIRNILMLATVLAAAIFVESYSRTFLYQVPVVLALGFVFGQFAFLAHDTGHEQISSRIFPLSYVHSFTNIFLYGSLTGWRIKHNLHHHEPNNIALDPDCDVHMLAFTREQAETKKGLARFLVSYQQYFFLPISALTAISMRTSGIQFLLSTRHPDTLRELLISSMSLAGYAILWISVFGLVKAIVFMLVTEFVFGMYMGMTFVTNHYGCSFEPTTDTDFLTKQVVTSRNLGSTSKILDTCIHFVYGGLNRQIEHHLWSYMPRCNLGRAEIMVRELCSKVGIKHHVVTPFRAYQEIFRNFSDISRHMRSVRKNE